MIDFLDPLRDLIDQLRQGKGSKSPDLPYGLSKSDLTDLRSLISSKEWKTYLSLLDTVCKLNVQGVLASKDDVAWERGFVTGLRKAGFLPDEIVHKVERERERRDQREREYGERADERRRLALYGTSFWRDGENGR